jgi:DNA-binding ferritin-like protein
MADGPETSDFTSFAERITALKSQPAEEAEKTTNNQSIQLLQDVQTVRMCTKELVKATWV